MLISSCRGIVAESWTSADLEVFRARLRFRVISGGSVDASSFKLRPSDCLFKSILSS